MAHTPGPWRLEFGDTIYSANNPKPIATVENDVAEYEANGDLIKAAPDLLAALKWLADSASASQESQSPEAREWYAKDVWHGIELARDAIAKAEGK